MTDEISAVTSYEKGKLYEIDINVLNTDPKQPRKIMDTQALDELAASIGKVGIIQPIVFRKDNQGAMIIVAGERRVSAARQAGLTTIPGIYIEGNYAEIALVENLLRQDLTAVEEAEALQSLMNERQYTQDQLGAIIGKARSTLSEILSLNKLPEEIRDDCRGDRTISRATLITIAKKKQARAMTTAYNTYKAKQAKAKTIRVKKDFTDPKTITDEINKLLVKIQSIDTTAWTDDGRAAFQSSLSGLKAGIDIYLAGLAASEPERPDSGEII
jgi:ParB family chromosome partitioning protein